MNDKKIKIIYIASNGRSGSTLLELLLNGFRTVRTLGEVNVLPWEVKEEKGVCGCGKKISRCDFWSGVLKEVGGVVGVDGEIHKFRESHKAGKILRPREILRILFHTSPRKKKLAKFCTDNVKLFSIVKREIKNKDDEEINYLVDSSKDSYRLYWLTTCDGIGVKVIHIVKDPRAFVYAMTKGDSTRVFTKTIRMSIRYVVENLLIERVIKKMPERDVLFVRYEDLASESEKTLKAISTWLGIPYQNNIITSFYKNENHGIAGNEMRHQSREILLDERWKTDLSPAAKGIITFLTYFRAKKHGYFKK